MSSKRKTENEISKNKRKCLPLQLKLEIIRNVESGEKKSDVAKRLELSHSTVTTIMINAEKIKTAAQSSNSLTAAKITRIGNTKMIKMEKILNMWIEDQNARNIPLSQSIIMAKAKNIFEQIKIKEGESSTEETFTASRGWFDRFKNRSNLHSLQITGESASADIQAAKEFPKIFKNIIESEKFTPQLIFNVDETALFWKRMPNRTFISKDERQASGFKAAKDRLTILIGGNAAGDFKLKPMVVYHSETPRAMKGINKNCLPVFWRSNKRAWVTKSIFQDWFDNCFCPEVKRYCEKNKWAPRALLLLDNAPGHPFDMEINAPIPVKIVFMPPNTTSLLQPMDQGVIANFKACYLRLTFRQLIQDTDSGNRPSIKDWWKSYNIMKAVDNIGNSWIEVSNKCMNGVWRKLWPEVVQNEEVILNPDVSDIVNLANEAGLGEDDLSADDIVELLKSYEELTIEDLVEACDVPINENEVDVEENDEPKLVMKDLKKELNSISLAVEKITEMDPDFDRAMTMKRKINDALFAYHEFIKEESKNAKQTTLEKFFKKQT